MGVSQNYVFWTVSTFGMVIRRVKIVEPHNMSYPVREGRPQCDPTSLELRTYSTFANKWKFEQMEISRFFLQLFREQMEISAISYQMRLFFVILLQLIREQMEI